MLNRWQQFAGLLLDIVHNTGRERTGKTFGNGDVAHADKRP